MRTVEEVKKSQGDAVLILIILEVLYELLLKNCSKNKLVRVLILIILEVLYEADS